MMRKLRKQHLPHPAIGSRCTPLNVTCLVRTIAFIAITALQVHLSVWHLFSHPADTPTPLLLDLATPTSRRAFQAHQLDRTTYARNIKYATRNGTIQEPFVTATLKSPAEDYQPQKRQENWDQNDNSKNQILLLSNAPQTMIISNRTMEQSPLKIEPKNRSIILIHVGKAGGMTIRRTLPIPCESRAFKGDAHEQLVALEKCQEHVRTLKLASQIRSTFHMWDYNTTHLEQATSYIVTLRNPVDRIISTYRYNHPQNCNLTSSTSANANAKPSLMEGIKGCNLLKFGLVDDPGSMGYQIFRHCFPSPAMEDFAQSVMKPWRPNDNLDNFTSTAERAKCRQLAKHLVQGGHNRRIIPHMMCNYHYYATHSIWKYPGKEVFGIRTEHEWDDMVALDKLLGGTGTFRNANLHHSHGSEHYHPSPISTEAYHKLCCALETEIEIYFNLLDQSVNLDNAAKEESKAIVREKCDITPSWLEWRAACLQRMNDSDLDNKEEMST